MAITYKLRAEYASYGGGVIAFGQYASSFNVGAALTAGSGSIVVSDAALADALDKYPPLFRFSDNGVPLTPPIDVRYKSLGVGGILGATDVTIEVRRDVDTQARFQVLGNGKTISFNDVVANSGAVNGQIALTSFGGKAYLRFGTTGADGDLFDMIGFLWDTTYGFLRTNAPISLESGALMPLLQFGYAVNPSNLIISESLGDLYIQGGGVTADGGFGVNGASVHTKQTVTGSRGGNAALASVLTALAAYGLILNSTTA